MTNIETEVYQKTDEGIIGAQVIVYNGGEEVDSIRVVTQSDFDELVAELEALPDTVVEFAEDSSLAGRTLDAILQNSLENANINATKLGGFQSDAYSKTGHTHTADDITDLNSNLEFASVYGAPSSAFDASNINKEKTHSFTAYKLGNIVMYKFNFTTLSFTSGVLGSDRNVITTLPNFVQGEGTWRIHAINAGGSAPCLVSVGNGLTIRPYVATAYAVIGSGFYVAKNTDLE